MAVTTVEHAVVGRKLRWAAAAAIAVAGGVAAVRGGAASWWLLAGAAVAPDLSFLAALGAPFGEHGRLAPRAVPAYNLVHRPALPVVLGAAAALGLTPAWTFVVASGWFAHIAVDRVSGYGLRTPEGWQRG